MRINKPQQSQRRVYPDELKKGAVQVPLDGHSATAVAESVGLPHTPLRYRRKAQALDPEGAAAAALVGAAAPTRRAVPPHGAGARHLKNGLSHFQPEPVAGLIP